MASDDKLEEVEASLSSLQHRLGVEVEKRSLLEDNFYRLGEEAGPSASYPIVLSFFILLFLLPVLLLLLLLLLCSCSCFYFAPTHTLPLTLCLALALALAGATPFWEHEGVGRRSAMPKGAATRPTRSWQSSVVSMSAAQRGPNGVTFGSNGCFGRNNAPISYSNGYM